MKQSEESYFVLEAEKFKFVATKHSHRILQDAFERYTRLVFMKEGLRVQAAQGNSEGLLRQVQVEVETDDYELNWKTDESYSLVVDNSGSVLRSKSIFGALRGLETFSQLTHRRTMSKNDGDDNNNGDANNNDDDNDKGEPICKVIYACTIEDRPRYAHRGLLIDTARHFLPVKILLGHIDALAYNKFNVLHWHIVDDQSFPFQSERYPLLSEKGAWAPDHVYSKHDVKKVVEYGYHRGIRIIPEFDSPGHASSWIRGYPQLGSVPASEQHTAMQMHGGRLPLTCPLNPVSNFTYELLQGLMSEVAELFPDHYVHVGGDEIPIDRCWQRLASEARTSPKALLANYEARLLDIIAKLDKEAILWEKVFTSGVPLRPGTVVALWKGQWQSKLLQVANAGLKAIVYAPWYLNYIKYGQSWKSYYQTDIGDSSALIGGSAAMWGEFVDATNSIARVWPFASAVGERLWSPRSVTDVNDAQYRLDRFRCLLVARGLTAQPPSGPNFCDIEYEPTYNPPFDIEKLDGLGDAHDSATALERLKHEISKMKADLLRLEK